MSDEEKKVVNLMDERHRRDHAAAHRAHDQGELFKFEPFEFIDDETPNGIGIVDGCHPITLLLDVEKLTGICMTPDTARRLAKELEGAVNEWEEDQKGEGA